MAVKDMIVVGGGIIGSTVAEFFRRRGIEAVLFDDGRPMGGTGPSGGHVNRNWCGKMTDADVDLSLAVLDDVWGVKTEPFDNDGRGDLYVGRVSTDLVLASGRTVVTVIGVDKLDSHPRVTYVRGGETYSVRCKTLVVAAGTWCFALVPGILTTAKQGVSFRLAGTVDKPIIRTWSPYKQVVVHQESTGVLWAGDGTAVLPQNWGSRTETSLNRCSAELGIALRPLETREGLRPYAKPIDETHPCLFTRLGPRAWAATGAGKRGTIAAGWVAERLTKELTKKPR
ncbi:MAG: NAD(P)-binding protein [Fimbriiglobus sp.]